MPLKRADLAFTSRSGFRTPPFCHHGQVRDPAAELITEIKSILSERSAQFSFPQVLESAEDGLIVPKS